MLHAYIINSKPPQTAEIIECSVQIRNSMGSMYHCTHWFKPDQRHFSTYNKNIFERYNKTKPVYSIAVYCM